MLEGRKIGAVLLMAGEGRRFGDSLPKQFAMLAGKPVYQHTLEAFQKAGFFDEIVLVCHRDWMGRAQGAKAVEGGRSRQESSYLGLRALAGMDVAVIHDAVRPFVTERILRENALGAVQWGAVDTCISSSDTLVHAPEGRVIESIPNRAEFFRGQTPQSFRMDWILEAHERALQERVSATDDCGLVLDMGREVRVVEGEESNIKITTELDLFLAEQLFRLKRDRIGPLDRPPSLEGKVYAVVGGTGGIGRAVVAQIEGAGGRALVLSRSGGYYLDLNSPETIEAAFERIYLEVGPLDGLINCAGKLFVSPLDQMSLREIEAVLRVNLEGVILTCRCARLKLGAHLVNVASSSFTRGRRDLGVYSGAKAGVVNFTQAIAEERPDLRVWAVVPQRTNTAMRREFFPLEDPQTLLDPKVVASHILSILCDAESTGQIAEVRLKKN